MYDQEIKKLLLKNIELSQDILRLTKKLNRARIASKIYSILKFVVIVALSVGAYYYVEPYIRTLMDSISSITSGVEQMRQTADGLVPSEIDGAGKNIFGTLKGFFGQ